MGTAELVAWQGRGADVSRRAARCLEVEMNGGVSHGILAGRDHGIRAPSRFWRLQPGTVMSGEILVVVELVSLRCAVLRDDAACFG